MSGGKRVRERREDACELKGKGPQPLTLFLSATDRKEMVKR